MYDYIYLFTPLLKIQDIDMQTLYTHIQTRQSIVQLHHKHFKINSESRNINYIEWEEYSERNNDEINEWQSVMNERMSQSLVQSDNHKYQILEHPL